MKFKEKLRKMFLEDDFEFLNIKLDVALKKFSLFYKIFGIWFIGLLLISIIPTPRIPNLSTFRLVVTIMALFMLLILIFFVKYLGSLQDYAENYDKILNKEIKKVDSLLKKKKTFHK